MLAFRLLSRRGFFSAAGNVGSGNIGSVLPPRALPVRDFSPKVLPDVGAGKGSVLSRKRERQGSSLMRSSLFALSSSNRTGFLSCGSNRKTHFL